MYIMAEKNKVNEKKVEKPIIAKLIVPKLKKQKYPLLKDVSIGGEIKKKGSFVELTEKGKEYFKKQFYIK